MLSINKKDEFIVGPYKIRGEDLYTMLNPRIRALWGLCERDGWLMPVMYTEDEVIWTTDIDWKRKNVEI